MLTHDEVVELSARSYRAYLDYQRTMGNLGSKATEALEDLVDSLELAMRRRTQLIAADMPFSRDKMSGLPEQDWMRFLNDFTLGFGSEQAQVIAVGTEEAYEAGSENLAEWNCGSAILWLCGSKQDVLGKLGGADRKSAGSERRRPYHIHPNDYDHVETGQGRHTWEGLAQVVAGGAEARSLLDGTASPSLGDLCYLAEISAFPAKSSTGGRSPTADRHRFLRKLIESLSRSARVLLFYGAAGDPHWGWRDDLAGVFLGAGDDGDGLEQAPEIAETLLHREDSNGRTVLFTRALSGAISNVYLDAIATRVDAALGRQR